MVKTGIHLFTALMLCLSSPMISQTRARSLDGNESANYFDMKIEELIEVKVVSASRQAQTIDELSVPVSAISSEDIHCGGLTSLGETFQFTLGVDMFKFNRYRDVVGVSDLLNKSIVLLNNTFTIKEHEISDRTFSPDYS